MSQQAGTIAEDKAYQYLLNQGLKPVERNFHCRHGEIDLIMRDKQCIVFVEVRARTSHRFGGALTSVTLAKQKKIMRTAMVYLTKHHLFGKYPMRFDVVSLDGEPARIAWIKQAFDTDALI